MVGRPLVGLLALVNPGTVAGLAAGPLAPLEICDIPRRQRIDESSIGAVQRVFLRRKSTGSSSPRLRLTWIVSGGRPAMAVSRGDVCTSRLSRSSVVFECGGYVMETSCNRL
jgi:hypothetical protein